jgi:hypothetical protein
VPVESRVWGRGSSAVDILSVNECGGRGRWEGGGLGGCSCGHKSINVTTACLARRPRTRRPPR